MSKNRDERKRQKQLAHLTEIATAFLKARAVYPPEYDGFLEVAGQKEVDVFYQTMYLVEKGAKKWEYTFDWYYDQKTNEWTFVFTDVREVKI
ncbi:MAG: hypothetical protein IJW55_09465 [Clostridia bacterium]|nr:hypothetical protein [Clostridia bacterium]